MMTTRFNVMFKKVVDAAREPTKGSEHAAGWDLYSAERSPVLVAFNEVSIIRTGLQLWMPPNIYARIAPRSGLAANRGIDTLAGVVDADYRGEVKVVLTKVNEGAIYLYPGDRIAQIVFEMLAPVKSLQEVQEIPDTGRGESGFGSTGGYNGN